MGRVREEKRRERREEKRRRKRAKREISEERRFRCEKVGKSPNTVFFPMICGSGGSKSRLAKAAGAEPSGQMRSEKLHAPVERSTFRSQNIQNAPCSDHFWKLSCRKVHAVATRSTFRSQNVQNTSVSDHFLKLTCRKNARRCGTKHVFESKVKKN